MHCVDSGKRYGILLVETPFISRKTKTGRTQSHQDVLRRESTERAVKTFNMWLAGLVEPFDWFILWVSFLIVLLHFVTFFNAQGIRGD